MPGEARRVTLKCKVHNTVCLYTRYVIYTVRYNIILQCVVYNIIRAKKNEELINLAAFSPCKESSKKKREAERK